MWNHRVINLSEENKGEPWFAICEVYYENKLPWARTDAIAVSGESIEELKETLERMLRCLDNPILNKDDFKDE